MNFADIMSMGGELTGLGKSVTELVKGIRDLNAGEKPDSQKLISGAVETLRDKLMELNEKQLELHQSAIALAQENIGLIKSNHSLEVELAKLKNFDAERSAFERVPLAFNTFAYRERTFTGPADAQPLLCPNCFDNSKKTYLSFKEHVPHANAMHCTSCGTTVHVPRNESFGVQTVRVNRTLRGWNDGFLGDD